MLRALARTSPARAAPAPQRRDSLSDFGRVRALRDALAPVPVPDLDVDEAQQIPRARVHRQNRMHQHSAKVAALADRPVPLFGLLAVAQNDLARILDRQNVASLDGIGHARRRRLRKRARAHPRIAQKSSKTHLLAPHPAGDAPNPAAGVGDQRLVQQRPPGFQPGVAKAPDPIPLQIHSLHYRAPSRNTRQIRINPAHRNQQSMCAYDSRESGYPGATTRRRRRGPVVGAERFRLRMRRGPA